MAPALAKGRNLARWHGAGVERFTPRALFAVLHEEFAFTLDPCATEESATVPRFFTRDDDGLARDWHGERVFMNPPYGKGIYDWMRKAHLEARDHRALVVAVVPAATDTSWWHDLVVGAAEIRWTRGRVHFLRPGMIDDGGRSPHATAVIIWRPGLEAPSPNAVVDYVRGEQTPGQLELVAAEDDDGR